MKRRTTLLNSLRRESLPLALVGILVVLFQLLGPATSGKAAPVASVDGIVLCLGLDGDAAGHTPADHHGSDTCPCGPLCLHALASAHLLTPPDGSAIGATWNLTLHGAASWWPFRREVPDSPYLSVSSIRAPPFPAI
jgi:hypothetical protein